MERSLKQKWSYERLFMHKGSLEGIKTRLRQIADAASTLPTESTKIFAAIDLLNRVDIVGDKEASWTKYEWRKG